MLKRERVCARPFVCPTQVAIDISPMHAGLSPSGLGNKNCNCDIPPWDTMKWDSLAVCDGDSSFLWSQAT